MDKVKKFVSVLHKKAKNIIGGVLYSLLCLVVIFGVGVYAALSLLWFLVNAIKGKIINAIQ